ncbi:stage V sporulation protein AE [Alteribacter natronophilus]|uniref:stage V sporulation protein AE n=1 Tax=Alteribacter natronophilus TaxID=2583810 RepID=UPI00110E2C95|nr:stage V sporulation protein AE [Alteribacter natronophilus]TMW73671.1 stage V sporulation protein AE [Alteribacter natronophilus]
MSAKKKVIVITDGDASARAAAEKAAEKLNCFFIAESCGNPSPVTGDILIRHILRAEKEPVLVLFDDCGYAEEGPGEKALLTVCRHPDIEILGVLAVASQSFAHEWAKVHFSIERNGTLTEYGVDKDGIKDTEIGRIRGDTVYVLDELDLPLVIGIGDLGKMGGRDTAEKGAPVTSKALELILERSGFNGGKSSGFNKS